jgi:hypothetical protein
MVSVPKATMYKNSYVRGREHNVGIARETSPVETEAESTPMKRTPNQDLRLGILGADRCHYRGALLLGK